MRYDKSSDESMYVTANGLVEQAYCSGEPAEVDWGSDTITVEISNDATTATITSNGETTTISFDESIEAVYIALETSADRQQKEAGL